jgi:haloacetate dehalogenase
LRGLPRAASIDLEHNEADKDQRIMAPLLALWGAKGAVNATYDVLATWREKALDVQGHAIPCGYALQEEALDATTEALLPFLSETKR